MRRKPCMSRSLCESLVLALLMSGLPGGLRAQQGETTPAGSLVVPIDGTLRLQMSTKRPIRTITNSNEKLLDVRTVIADSTTVLLIGREPGQARIDMTDADGRKESFRVTIQADAEFVRSRIREAVPSSNVTAIPSPKGIILMGSVSRVKDADVIRKLVRDLGLDLIDRIRVGPPLEYRLTVTLTESVPGGEDVIVKPSRRVAENRLAEVRHRSSDQSSLRVYASVLQVERGTLQVSLDVESRRVDPEVRVWGHPGQEVRRAHTTYEIAPGEIIRVKLSKAGYAGGIRTVDVRIDRGGEKGEPRVHLLDFGSGLSGACIVPAEGR